MLLTICSLTVDSLNVVVDCGNCFSTRGQNVRDSLQRWPASKSRKVFGYYDKIDGITVLKGVEIKKKEKEKKKKRKKGRQRKKEKENREKVKEEKKRRNEE